MNVLNSVYYKILLKHIKYVNTTVMLHRLLIMYISMKKVDVHCTGNLRIILFLLRVYYEHNNESNSSLKLILKEK